MTFDANAIAAFFEEGGQMGIPHETVQGLSDQGIDSPDDLSEFDKDSLNQVMEYLRKPGDRIASTVAGAAAGATMARPAYKISAKSLTRLIMAAELVRY